MFGAQKISIVKTNKKSLKSIGSGGYGGSSDSGRGRERGGHHGGAGDRWEVLATARRNMVFLGMCVCVEEVVVVVAETKEQGGGQEGGKRWLMAQRSWEGSKEVIEVTQRSGES